MSASTSNPPLASVDSKAPEPELSSPPTITDQEIGEFREQDRVLPVSLTKAPATLVYMVG